ncbi:MAG: replication factor C large subunit [Nanoarchaeota archaeon]|nr:replication factor C large subunit [Nanoarchaeota archaeon]
MYLTNSCVPKKADEFTGREPELKQIRDFVENYRGGAMLVHGQTGCGKTSFAHVLAKELGLEILELNASDLRNKGAILSIAKNAALQMSLFASGKVILIDEIDGMSSSDRGAVSAITEVIKESKWPLILTANDLMNERVQDLKKKCRFVELPSPRSDDMYSILSNACSSNGICYEETALRSLARQSSGDVRASMIDLFVASFCGGLKDTTMLTDRLRAKRIEESLALVFNTTKANISLSAFDNTDKDLNECLMWLEENIPKEYRGMELKNAYDALSKADVYLGRIRRWQHWRFLVYANAMLTAGVALSKSDLHRKQPDVRYSRNSRPLKYWIMNNKNAKKKAIAAKMAAKCHVSKRKALKCFMPYFKIQYGNNSQQIGKELSLEEEHEEWIRE